jgi:hypothetical protein
MHQPLAQLGSRQPQRFQGEVERIAGDLPEIRVLPLERAQPSVLKLLLAPECVQPVELVAQHVAASRCRRSVVEECPISVEDVGADVGH